MSAYSSHSGQSDDADDFDHSGQSSASEEGADKSGAVGAELLCGWDFDAARNEAESLEVLRDLLVWFR